MLWVQEIPTPGTNGLMWGPLISPSCCSHSSWSCGIGAGTGKKIESPDVFIFVPASPWADAKLPLAPCLSLAGLALSYVPKKKVGEHFVWRRCGAEGAGSHMMESEFPLWAGPGLLPQACTEWITAVWLLVGPSPPTTRASGKQAEGNRWAEASCRLCPHTPTPEHLATSKSKHQKRHRGVFQGAETQPGFRVPPVINFLASGQTQHGPA